MNELENRFYREPDDVPMYVLPRTPIQAPATGADALMQVIIRAAADTTIDLGRMDHLFAIHKKMVDREEEKLFDVAMAAAQAGMRSVAADKDNNQTRSRYASYAALDAAITPIYTAHGFSLRMG
jgi:hypothetical protein